MVRCPEGHESEATDYCDTCGAPIGAPPTAPADPSAAAGAAGAPSPGAGGSLLDLDEPVARTQSCPHCGGVNVADALFCEACGYDFTTGALPLGAEPEETEAVAEPEETEAVAEPEETEAVAEPEETEAVAEPKELETAEPVPLAEQDPLAAQDPVVEPEHADTAEPDPVAEPEKSETPGPEADPIAEPETPGPEPRPDPTPQPESGPHPEPQQPPAPTAPETDAVGHARPRHTPPSRDLADTWVVEVWVDPDWYAVQQTAEACPSAGVPDVVVVRRSVVMVGRPSGSLGVRPEVDAGADSAVSRRHAQLTSDGTRWWIEDLGSSNGTYVGVVGEPLPTQALTPGQRVEIDRDDRIYVGAWTRLVLRQATAAERAGQG